MAIHTSNKRKKLANLQYFDKKTRVIRGMTGDLPTLHEQFRNHLLYRWAGTSPVITPITRVNKKGFGVWERCREQKVKLVREKLLR